MIIYESAIEGAPDSSPLQEESIRVLRADSEPLALKKAQTFGQKNEHSYRNEQGELVVWKFKGVVEVQDLCEEELTDGVEVFSRMSRLNVAG